MGVGGRVLSAVGAADRQGPGRIDDIPARRTGHPPPAARRVCSTPAASRRAGAVAVTQAKSFAKQRSRVILSPGPELVIGPEVLPVPPAAVVPAATDRAPAPAPVALVQVEREHIVAVLKQTGWRIDGPQGAAKLLNMNPSTLRSRMQKLGIRRSADGLS